MARLSRRIGPALVGLAAIGSAALFASPGASATPATPGATPSVTSVQQQLGKLAVQDAQVVEQYNQATVDVAARQEAADAAGAKAARSQAEYARVRVQLSQTVAAQYEGGSFSATGALLSSADGNSYLDRLDTLNVMSANTAQMITRAATAQKAAKSAQAQASSLVASATAKRTALAVEKDTVQKQIDKYKTLLATLSSAQRAAFSRSINPGAAPADVTGAITALAAPGVSKLAKIAVEFALAQVGKPYVWGAAGPANFDCSGLTMRAWEAAGVSLPHSAAGQINYGTHVTIDQLQPGDLVFLYHPIGHVEIYIGNGLLVSAPQSGENVKVVQLGSYADAFSGATRLP